MTLDYYNKHMHACQPLFSFFLKIFLFLEILVTNERFCVMIRTYILGLETD